MQANCSLCFQKLVKSAIFLLSSKTNMRISIKMTHTEENFERLDASSQIRSSERRRELMAKRAQDHERRLARDVYQVRSSLKTWVVRASKLVFSRIRRPWFARSIGQRYVQSCATVAQENARNKGTVVSKRSLSRLVLASLVSIECGKYMYNVVCCVAGACYQTHELSHI